MKNFRDEQKKQCTCKIKMQNAKKFIIIIIIMIVTAAFLLYY